MALHANVVIVSGIRRYEGTAAALAASTFEGIPAGSTFLETDTGVIYVLDKALALQPKYEQVKIAAGTAIVGKVGIDQTTDGTTNKVQARNATADNFQVNANLQVGDADNAVGNPAFVQLTDSNVEETIGEDIPDKAVLIGAEDASGDLQAAQIDANGNIYINPAPLDEDTDKIDVAKMSKGGMAVVHSAITGTATSTEQSADGFNSLLIEVELDAAHNWTFKLQGSMISGGTFKDWYELANTGVMTAMSYQCNASRGFVFKGIPDYYKIVATEDEDGATVTVRCQPLNL